MYPTPLVPSAECIQVGIEQYKKGLRRQAGRRPAQQDFPSNELRTRKTEQIGTEQDSEGDNKAGKMRTTSEQ